MNRRTFLKIGTTATVATTLGDLRTAASEFPEATVAKLPRWRGFNLLEKFNSSKSGAFVESDFEWLTSWGFNFTRLPMDYRCWSKTPGGDFEEATMADIDQAVAWGKQYNIHININFHRAPGYCVNQPKEIGDLWNEPASQEEFARQWGIFAKRYAKVPGRQLSFDLVNEPSGVTGPKYASALKPAIDAIKAADPERLIITDGLAFGSTPVQELIPFEIAQSTHVYEPMEVTHFRASWIPGSDKLPLPVWPVPKRINNYLYGPDKPDFQGPLTLQVQCPQATQFGLHVDEVSHEAGLVVKADGALVFQQLLKPGPGAGDWKQSVANHAGGYYARYDREYSAAIPAGTREIEVSLDRGDWLTFTALRINGAVVQVSDKHWGQKQDVFILDSQGAHPQTPGFTCSKETLWNDRIKPWLNLKTKGVGVHVGEWGVFNRTPQAVALAWMKDCLENWQKAGFGWALWNFCGSFGILDSDRADMNYEGFKGHKLDRQMLELLRTY